MEEFENMTESELMKKANNAAARYLERSGEVEIIERDWAVGPVSVPIIAKHEEDGERYIVFVFVDCDMGLDDGFPDETFYLKNRSLFEIIAANYLASADPSIVDSHVIFDHISLLALGNDRAFLRHHHNILSDHIAEGGEE